MRGEFHEPDWDGPLDLEERLEQLSADAMTYGFAFRGAVEDLVSATGSDGGYPDYGPFARYPIRDFIRFVPDIAPKLHPGVPPREALRRMGRRQLPRIRDNTAGRMILAVAGNRLASAFKVVGRLYQLMSAAEATLVESGPHFALVQVRNIWTFPYAYQLAVYEGALEMYGHRGTVRYRQHSICDYDYLVEWE